MTEGRRLLLRVLTKTKVEFVAKRCQVTTGAVYNWLSGLNTPGPKARRLLFQSYGIPPEIWDRLQ